MQTKTIAELQKIRHNCQPPLNIQQQYGAYLKAVKGGNRIPYKINVRKYAYDATTYYGEVRGKHEAKEVHKFCEAPNWVEENQRQTRDKPREYDGQNIHDDR